MQAIIIISQKKNYRQCVEIKCQLDATDDIYCRFYCLLNMFRAPLCPSSGAREYYTDGRYLWYLVLARRGKSALLSPFNLQPPNDIYIYIYIYIHTHTHICRTAPLTSRCCILYIYSTNIRTEYFKHAAHSPYFFLFKMPFIS